MSKLPYYIVLDENASDKWKIQVTEGIINIESTSDSVDDNPIMEDTIDTGQHYKIIVNEGVIGVETTATIQDDVVELKDTANTNLWRLQVSDGVVNVLTIEYVNKDYTIELRSKNGIFKDYLMPYADGVSWEWNRFGGCGRCKMVLHTGYRDIDISDRDDIRIRIKDGSTSKLVYRGFVDLIVPSLKTEQTIRIDIKGYFSALDKLMVQDSGDTKIYSNQLLSDTVEDIIDNFVVDSSNITKGTIDPHTFAADTLEFRNSVSEALRTIAGLAGDVEYGVDEDLVFFWRTEDETLNHRFFVGDNVSMLERRIDYSKLINKIYFEGGDDLKKTAEANDSQSLYHVSEKIIINSSIVTDTVADKYLTNILKERSQPTLIVRGKVVNTSDRIEDNIPLGMVSFYDADHDEGLYIVGEAGDGGSDLTVGLADDGGSDATVGGEYKGQVDRIRYTLSDEDERFNLEITLGDTILETSAKLKQMELELSALRQR